MVLHSVTLESSHGASAVALCLRRKALKSNHDSSRPALRDTALHEASASTPTAQNPAKRRAYEVSCSMRFSVQRRATGSAASARLLDGIDDGCHGSDFSLERRGLGYNLVGEQQHGRQLHPYLQE